MVICPGDLHARCIRRDALPHPRTGTVMTELLVLSIAPVIVHWSGAANSLRASDLSDGLLSRSGAQT